MFNVDNVFSHSVDNDQWVSIISIQIDTWVGPLSLYKIGNGQLDLLESYKGTQNFESGSRDPKPRPLWTLNVEFVYKSIYAYLLPNFMLLDPLLSMDESNVNGPF